MSPPLAALLVVAGLAVLMFLPAWIEMRRMKREYRKLIDRAPRAPPLRVVRNQNRYRIDRAIDEDLPGTFRGDRNDE